jgi:hypothetical protein
MQHSTRIEIDYSNMATSTNMHYIKHELHSECCFHVKCSFFNSVSQIGIPYRVLMGKYTGETYVKGKMDVKINVI